MNALDPAQKWSLENERAPQLEVFVELFNDTLEGSVDYSKLRQELGGSINTSLRNAQHKAQKNRVTSHDGTQAQEVVTLPGIEPIVFNQQFEAVVTFKNLQCTVPAVLPFKVSALGRR